MEHSMEERLYAVEQAIRNLIKEMAAVTEQQSRQLVQVLESVLSNKLLIPNKEHLDVSETCLFLGVSKSHLYKLTHNKVIPYYKTGKKNYFKREDLEYYITKYRIKSKNEIDEYVVKHLKAA